MPGYQLRHTLFEVRMTSVIGNPGCRVNELLLRFMPNVHEIDTRGMVDM